MDPAQRHNTSFIIHQTQDVSVYCHSKRRRPPGAVRRHAATQQHSYAALPLRPTQCFTAASAHLQACAHVPAVQCTCVGTTCDALTASVKEVPARLQRLSVFFGHRGGGPHRLAINTKAK